MKGKRSGDVLVGDKWFPRCSLEGWRGFFINLMVAAFLSLHASGLLDPLSVGDAAEPQNDEMRDLDEEAFRRPDFTSLTVRLSTKPVIPPAHLVKRTISLEGFQLRDSFRKPAVQSAIIEDESRRGALVLTKGKGDSLGDPIQAYLLYDVALEQQLPEVRTCYQVRQCPADREVTTGGIACLAVCLVDALRVFASPLSEGQD